MPLSVSTNAEKIFNILLLLYPEQYRKKYGEEMRLVFNDMYQEEVAKHRKVGLGFWFSQICDISKSVIEQHIDEMSKKGMKKYLQQTLHINRFNVIGGVLLLPFLFLFGIDFLGRLVQGDFTHYNRAWYAVISHTFFYGNFPGQIPLMWAFLILFPILAVILNLIPFIALLSKKKITLKTLSFTNPLAIMIIALGFFCLLVVFGHDVVPCMVHGLLRVGFGRIGQVISVCRNA